MHVYAALATLALASTALVPGGTYAATSPNTAVQTNSAVTATTTNTPQTTYEAKSQTDGSVVVSLKHGKFVSEDKQVRIVNENGKTLEVLPSALTDSSGNRFSVIYSILSSDHLRVQQALPPASSHTERSSWGEYGKCVAKNTVGGAVGGAAAGCLGGWLGIIPQACGAGAAGGAVTGAVGTGVGSLFWCW